jgi:diguanylate cyclase (GGDEF)-like protein
VTIEGSNPLPSKAAIPAANLLSWLAAGAWLFAAILIGAAMQPGLREGVLLGLVAILATVVVLLLWRHRQSKARLAAERRQLSTAVNNIPQGLVLYDASARIVICNQPYIEMFGLSPEVVKPGCTMQRLIAHRKETGSFDGDIDEFCNAIIRNVSLGKATRQLTEAPGGRAIEIVNKPLKSGGWVATIEDITERTRADQKIAHMAHYDALTDLPNRVLFRERLEQALQALGPGEQLAVLYIDIDEFKSVNDALGHLIGDELLKGVADRLRGCLKHCDVAARLGGDEFAVIQTAVSHPSETTQLVERIFQAIRKPFECVDHLITTDASIGIALAPCDGSDLHQLLKNADLALYGAKGDGRRTYRFFEAGMDARAKARRSLELELRQALADGTFEVYYQPVLDLEDGTVSLRGAAALAPSRTRLHLARGIHPDRGRDRPDQRTRLLRARCGLPRGRWLAGTGPRRRQRFAGAVQKPGTRPQRRCGVGKIRHRGLPARTRDHRGGAHSRRRGRAGSTASAPRLGRADRA